MTLKLFTIIKNIVDHHVPLILMEEMSLMMSLIIPLWVRKQSRPTWKLFISLHPSDGGGGLTAHGGAGHLCFVALAQDLIPGLDDGVTWRNYDRTHKQNCVNTGEI